MHIHNYIYIYIYIYIFWSTFDRTHAYWTAIVMWSFVPCNISVRICSSLVLPVSCACQVSGTHTHSHVPWVVRIMNVSQYSQGINIFLFSIYFISMIQLNSHQCVSTQQLLSLRLRKNRLMRLIFSFYGN